MTDPIGFNPNQKEPLLVVISGPSGVGKDTVIQRMKERDLPFHFVVTATTRPPRPDEVHGVAHQSFLSFLFKYSFKSTLWLSLYTLLEDYILEDGR